MALENQLGNRVISDYYYNLNNAGDRLLVIKADERMASYTDNNLYPFSEGDRDD